MHKKMGRRGFGTGVRHNQSFKCGEKEADGAKILVESERKAFSICSRHIKQLVGTEELGCRNHRAGPSPQRLHGSWESAAVRAACEHQGCRIERWTQ